MQIARIQMFFTTTASFLGWKAAALFFFLRAIQPLVSYRLQACRVTSTCTLMLGRGQKSVTVIHQPGGYGARGRRSRVSRARVRIGSPVVPGRRGGHRAVLGVTKASCSGTFQPALIRGRSWRGSAWCVLAISVLGLSLSHANER